MYPVHLFLVYLSKLSGINRYVCENLTPVFILCSAKIKLNWVTSGNDKGNRRICIMTMRGIGKFLDK